MDATVIEQYTQPIPKLETRLDQSRESTVDHTETIRRLTETLEQQNRKIQQLESDLQQLRVWLARNSR